MPPLSNIRVLDLSRVFAGPYTTQLLADLGAEVIKVERPTQGDDMRGYGPPFLKDRDGKETGESSYYLAANRNKKGITVDFSKPEGRALILDLAKRADVLVENYKVGDLARYGLGYEALKAINPGIVYCSVTGFGQSGPYKRRPGLDGTIQAMGGLMSLTGDPDGPPQRSGIVAADFSTAMYSAVAILSALYHRDAQGGLGQYIDMALLDVQVAMLSHRALHYFISGEVPKRVGTGTPASVPSQTFPCSDGDVFLSAATDPQFERLCRQVIHRPDLPQDARFRTRRDRFRNKPDLLAILDALLARNPMKHWVDACEAANIVCSPVNNLAQVFEDEQVRARDMVVEVDHVQADGLRLVRNPIRLSDTPIESYTAPPVMGQHTDEVLRDELGLDADEIARLRAAGVV